MVQLAASAADQSQAPSAGLAGAPIDRDHLKRMTLGDRSLELEVLQLFDRQAELLVGRMRQAEPAALFALAHALKGSARGIGAWGVADAAEALERTAAAPGDERAAALNGLAAAVAAARATIAELLPTV
jgi:HPt (histidine-containing phosphotransfer) domain-containing protein